MVHLRTAMILFGIGERLAQAELIQITVTVEDTQGGLRASDSC